jgi:hypothetical protein
MAQERLRIEQKDLGGKACQRSVQKGSSTLEELLKQVVETVAIYI